MGSYLYEKIVRKVHIYVLIVFGELDNAVEDVAMTTWLVVEGLVAQCHVYYSAPQFV